MTKPDTTQPATDETLVEQLHDYFDHFVVGTLPDGGKPIFQIWEDDVKVDALLYLYNLMSNYTAERVRKAQLDELYSLPTDGGWAESALDRAVFDRIEELQNQKAE